MMTSPRPNYAVAPGSHLAEWMQEHGRTHEELRQRMSWPQFQVEGLLNGGKSLTQEIGDALADWTAIPVRHWIRLEAQYRSDLEWIQEELCRDYWNMVGRWSWRVAVENTIGGWCIVPGWDERTPADGALVIVGMILQEEVAKHVVQMHNTWADHIEPEDSPNRD